jgi:hypothetical protein
VVCCYRYGTALIAASANSKEYMVDLLLQQDDLDVNQSNSRAETALMHAAKVHKHWCTLSSIERVHYMLSCYTCRYSIIY